MQTHPVSGVFDLRRLRFARPTDPVDDELRALAGGYRSTVALPIEPRERVSWPSQRAGPRCWSTSSSESRSQLETYRNGHAKPDGALARGASFAGQGEWAGADRVLMVLEVTSYDADTGKRDREQKPRVYAKTGISVYLLIVHEAGEVLVHRGAPEGGVYSVLARRPFGKGSSCQRRSESSSSQSR